MLTGVPRVVWLTAIAVCLTFLYSSCAAIGAAVGTGIGLATGQPEVALVTGPGGAWIGDKFAEGKREKERADKAEAALDRERQLESDLRATLLANKQIAEHNTSLSPGEFPTPLYGPPMPTPSPESKPLLSRTLWEIITGRGK